MTLIKRRIPVSIPAPCVKPLFVRVVAGTISVLCNYYAIDHLVLANSNSLSKLGPFFAIVFSAVFLKEKIHRTQLWCITLALAGCAWIILPNFSTIGIAACAGLLCGIMTGLTHTALRYLRKNGELDGNIIIFVFSTVFTGLLLVPMIRSWKPMDIASLFVPETKCQNILSTQSQKRLDNPSLQ